MDEILGNQLINTISEWSKKSIEVVDLLKRFNEEYNVDTFVEPINLQGINELDEDVLRGLMLKLKGKSIIHQITDEGTMLWYLLLTENFYGSDFAIEMVADHQDKWQEWHLVVFKLATIAYEIRQIELCYDLCHHSLSLDETHYPSLALLGQAANALNKYVEAEQAYKEALELLSHKRDWEGYYTDLFRIYSRYAKHLYITQQYEQCISIVEMTLDIAISLNSLQPVADELKLILAESYRKLGDEEKYKKILEFDF